MTMLTDYVLAGVGALLALRLRRRAGGRAVALWSGGLATTGAAALAGGSWHGFAPFLSAAQSAALWTLTYTLIGLGNLLLLAGGVLAVATGPLRQGLLVALVVRFALSTAYLTAHPSFRHVLLDLGLTLLALLALAAHPRLAGRGRGPLGIALAITVTGAGVQQSPLALGPLNHNDLFHLIQTVGLYFLYRAGLGLEDAGGPG